MHDRKICASLFACFCTTITLQYVVTLSFWQWVFLLPRLFRPFWCCVFSLQLGCHLIYSVIVVAVTFYFYSFSFNQTFELMFYGWHNSKLKYTQTDTAVQVVQRTYFSGMHTALQAMMLCNKIHLNVMCCVSQPASQCTLWHQTTILNRSIKSHLMKMPRRKKFHFTKCFWQRIWPKFTNEKITRKRKW